MKPTAKNTESQRTPGKRVTTSITAPRNDAKLRKVPLQDKDGIDQEVGGGSSEEGEEQVQVPSRTHVSFSQRSCLRAKVPQAREEKLQVPPAEVLLVAFPPRDLVPKINSIPHERLSELRVCDNLPLATTTVGMNPAQLYATVSDTMKTTNNRIEEICSGVDVGLQEQLMLQCAESLYLSAPSLRETGNAIPRVANRFHSEAR